MLCLLLACSVALVAQEKEQLPADSLKKEVRVFGTDIEKAYSTASVSSVAGTTAGKINTPNLGNSLPGQLTGLMVSQNGSAPGYEDWPWMLIRGKGSFLGEDGNDVKVVVDGFVTKWYNLIPEEIESISVLKDAAALALYGIDAANGVLYIKTKRGEKRDKSRISFNARFSLQRPSILPEYVSNGEYASLYNEAMLQDGKDISSGPFGNEYAVRYYQDGTYPYLFADVDWVDEITKKQGFASDYTFSVNGGNNQAAYHVVLGYMNVQGLYDNTDGKNTSNWNLNRYSVRTNLDMKITDYLRSEVSLRATVDDRQYPNMTESSLWKNMGLFIPYAVRTESGDWGGSQNYPENPAASVLGKGYRSDNDRTIDANVKLIGDLGALTEGLEAFGQVVLSNNYLSSYNKTRDYSYTEYVTELDRFGFVDYTTVKRGTDDNNFVIKQPSGSQWNRYNVLGGLTYDRVFHSLHRVHASALYRQELYRTQGKDMAWTRMGMAGRLNYRYDDKYIAEFAYSFMGSGEYAPGKRFGFFPTISGAWILSKEPFLKDNTMVDFLKLSASYGLIGNNNMGGGSRFTYKQYYIGTGDPYYLGNGLGTTVWPKKQGSLANPQVTWEKATKFNIALAGSLFRQFDFNIEYFRDHRTDIFVAPASYMSALIGAEYYNRNVGVAKNQGMELELTYHNRTGDWGYFATGRLSYSKNEVVDMKESPKPYDYLYRKGSVIDQPFVLEAIGYFKDEADIANSPLQMFGSVQPGDVKYKDQNGDRIIDDNDKVPIGNPSYPALYYGLNLGVDYKGFDLSVFFQGVGQRTVSLLGSGFMTPFVGGGVKPHPELADGYWTPERGDAARFPRLTTEANNNNYQPSTLWQIDGSYFRIKNIELGYTIPAGTIPFVSGLRVYANAVNLLTVSELGKYNLDPEVASPYRYPIMKSVNVGLSVQF